MNSSAVSPESGPVLVSVDVGLLASLVLAVLATVTLLALAALCCWRRLSSRTLLR